MHHSIISRAGSEERSNLSFHYRVRVLACFGLVLNICELLMSSIGRSYLLRKLMV